MPRKPPTPSSEVNHDTVRAYKDFCASMMLPYTIEESNYTIRFRSDFCNMKFHPRMEVAAFAGGNKVRKDIAATGLTPPDINRRDVESYDFNLEGLKLHTIGDAWNIDIKSAYSSVLFNHGLITKGTHNYLASISKKNRLAAVGMLAKHKKIFEMLGHDCLSEETVTADTANWFFFCMARTNEIMSECMRIAGRSFLFFWVDGIFISDPEKVPPICRYLESIGYRYSLDKCSNMLYYEQNNAEKLTYYKGDDYKELWLPKKNDKICQFLINLLSL